jgi:hypothetical protein
MKTFQDFLATRKKMTPQEFNEKNNDDVEVSNNTTHIYVYEEYYYIHINTNFSTHDRANTYMLNDSYGLTLGNEYIESDKLHTLERTLYNDWFIDNVMGKEEWLPYVGIHTPHKSGHYYIMFEDMGFRVEDISYGNDSVDTFRLSINNIELFDVLLPNSANDNSDKEQFNQFVVHHLERSSYDSSQFDRCEDSFDVYDNIVDMQESFELRFHQIARDYMVEVVGSFEPSSLDEFLNTMEILKIDGYSILKIWDNWNVLNESMTFGCEPKNMFEDDEKTRVSKEWDLKIENFEKVKNQIELEISNGKIPLDTHHLDFGKLAEYFDCSYLLNGCTSDEMASDVIDLVDDYLEFDCSITWSIQKPLDNGDELGSAMGSFDKNGDAMGSVDELELSRLANNHLKDRITVFEKTAVSMEALVRRSAQRIKELEDRIYELESQVDIKDEVFSPQSYPLLLTSLETLMYMKDDVRFKDENIPTRSKIVSQMKKINTLIIK